MVGDGRPKELDLPTPTGGKEFGVHPHHEIPEAFGEERGERHFALVDQMRRAAGSVKRVEGAKEIRGKLNSLVMRWLTASDEDKDKIIEEIGVIGQTWSPESKSHRVVAALRDAMARERRGEVEPGEPDQNLADQLDKVLSEPSVPPSERRRHDKRKESAAAKRARDDEAEGKRRERVLEGAEPPSDKDVEERNRPGPPGQATEDLSNAAGDPKDWEEIDPKKIIDPVDLKEVAEKLKEVIEDAAVLREVINALREVVVTTEDGPIRVPIYKGKTIEELHQMNRDFLEELILTNRHIRKDYYEHHLSAGVIWAARKIAIRAGGKGTKEWNLYQEIKTEYEAVRRALTDFHEAVVARDGMASAPPTTYSAAIGLGRFYGGEWMAYFATHPYWRDGFIKGFATPTPAVTPTKYEDAGEALGAMLRMRSGIQIKDPDKPGGQGVEYYLSDGTKILVVNQRGEYMERTKPANGWLYETYKTMAGKYYMGYLEVRHELIDAAFEFSHTIPDPSDPENPRKRIPVFICHFDPDSALWYDAFQNPKVMPQPWYESLQRKSFREALGTTLLKQLGWNENLSDEDNLALLGTADDFLKLPLARREKLGWDKRLSDDDNLVNLGLMRLHGEKRHDKYYKITCNTINFDTELIPEAAWKEFVWDGTFAKRGDFLTNHAQQLLYMQDTRTWLLEILMGGKIQEALDFLSSGRGWRHIAEPLAWVADRETAYWRDTISRWQMRTYRRFRERANRLNLARLLRGKLAEGLLDGNQRKIWFEGCGITNMSWSKNLQLIRDHQRVRQFLQGLNEVKVIRETLLDQTGVSYKDLAALAGLKIKKYHQAPIHLPLDPETDDWDTSENRQFLREMRDFLNGMHRHRTRPWQRTGRFLRKSDQLSFREKEAREKWIERWIRENPNRSSVPIKVRGKGEAKMDLVAVFEEWSTEVDFRLMRKFLNLPENRRKAWIEKNWREDQPNKVETILQVWPEFEEMTRKEWEEWLSSHPDEVEAMSHMTVDWPGRHLWTWGGLAERGEAAPGAEEHQRAMWSVAEDAAALNYEKRNWPWRFFGCPFDVWEREKHLFRLVRRTRGSMDLRPDEQKKWIVLADGTKIHDPADKVANQWLYSQLEWNPYVPNVNRHDRSHDPLRGIDPLRDLEMSGGESWAGHAEEVSPLWWSFTDRRHFFRYRARGSANYRWEQAKIAGRRYGMNPYAYWEERRLDREIETPEKRHRILKIMVRTFLDSDAATPFYRIFGCTEKEMIAHRDQRKQLRIPDEEDRVAEDVAGPIKQAAATVQKELAGLPGGTLWTTVTGGRTKTEVTRMVRNALVAGTAVSLGLDTAILIGTGGQVALGPWMILTAPIGFAAGMLAGFDRGDLVGALSWFLGKAGLLGERVSRHGPEALIVGYREPGLVRLLPKWFKEKMFIRALLPVGVNDDVIDAAKDVDTHATYRAQLGYEGLEK